MVPTAPRTFTIGNDIFRHGRLNALEEFHCCRRIGPLVSTAGGLAAILARPGDRAANGDGGAWLAGAIEGTAPLLRALTELSEEDANYVITRCMAVTETEVDGVWVPTWNSAAGAPALPHLNMNHLLRITYEVIREAITAFFSPGCRVCKNWA